jgi:hypothetical protein
MNSQLKLLLDTEFGGHFDPTCLSPNVRFVFDHPSLVATEALSQAYWIDGIEIKKHTLLVGFFESFGLDAGTVDTGDKESSIVLSHAFPILLLSACSRVVNLIDRVTMLPKCDRAGRVILVPTKVELIPPDLSERLSKQGTQAALDEILSDLESRNTLATTLLLYDLAIRFVVMHECMHIVLGHTAFAKKVLGLSRLMEMSGTRLRKMPPRLSQSLEFIADRHTVHGLTNWAISGRLGDYVEAATETSTRPTTQFMLRSLIVATMTLLHLFPNHATARESAQSSHPHPYQRMRWWMREMAAAVKNQGVDQEGVYEAYAYWLACFDRNVSAPGNWRSAALEDELDEQGRLLSDQAFEQMSADASRRQTKIWREYSPFFPGDGRDSSRI